jgi:hypothetical protein
MRNAFVSFIVGFLTFSPLLFSGCAESHDSIPAALADSCGDMGYAETMGPVEQSTMLNAALPEDIGICFVGLLGTTAPTPMVEGCMEYLSRAESCEDARARFNVCAGCWETWYYPDGI